MIRIRFFLLLAMGAALCAAPVRAQAKPAVASGIVAVLEVPYPPLTATGMRPVQFGLVVPGTPEVILPSYLPGTMSGEWRLTGVARARSLDISFVLPAALTAPGGRVLPISFNGNYAGLCEIDDATQTCETASWVTWNPVTTPSFRDTPQRWKPGRPKYEHDHYSVYMGGRVAPPAGQPGGDYTATITIQLVIN
jgi:hypothetical protein